MFSLRPHRRERPLAPRAVTPLEFLREEFTPLFERVFRGWPIPFEAYEEAPWGFETEEKEKEYVIRAELPGFEMGEIEILLSGTVLTIKAEHKEEAKGKEKEPVERHYGRAVRTVTLPVEVVPEKIEATYRNGILEVHLPKNPKAVPRKIEVKA